MLRREPSAVGHGPSGSPTIDELTGRGCVGVISLKYRPTPDIARYVDLQTYPAHTLTLWEIQDASSSNFGSGCLNGIQRNNLSVSRTTPPANSSTSPTTSPSSPNPNGDESNSAPDTQDAPAASADKSAQDPKMKACMKAEKAKNSGLDDNQLKQKCMLQIASHQGH